MRAKKGVSMTLTLVIVGVILIMTAVTMITFSSGSLAQFFGFGQENVKVSECQRQIASWCRASEREVRAEFNTSSAHPDVDPTCTRTPAGNDKATHSADITRNDCAADWTHNQAPSFTSGEYNCKENDAQVDVGGTCPP